jgi:hypothetical protein
MFKVLFRWQLFGLFVSTVITIMAAINREPVDLRIFPSLAALITVGFIGLMILVAILNGIDGAKIDREYHDAPDPAMCKDESEWSPRPEGPVADYIPKWQRAGYDPYED